MDVTRKSLLIRAREGDQGAWDDLHTLYRPLIVGWLHRQSIAARDVDDLVQEIFVAVYHGLPTFNHSGREGAFRAWIRTIAMNHSCNFWRSPARRVGTPGGPDADEALRQLEDPESELWQFWEKEHDRHLLQCLLEMMEIEFEPATMQAFRRVALEGATGLEAAKELGLSVGAVYTARSRVLRRLREVAGGLIDEIP
ncbi:RNA polymerase sigma factor [Aquisphaera insulae]|uniref:RNA polymerase sigma factor n=1 Tax=Aquisphaera insulae TaxID=2712864 RepID=UPI0013EB758B|nr:RNA polymerase sigma factor [Aquisphaera insulae]